MNTPTPERVTLTDSEREALIVDAMECGPWHYQGVLCSCGRPVDATDDTCAMQRNVIDAVERILAAREQALREEIAGEIERKAQHLNAAEDYGRGGRDGLNAAARIARGGAR